MGENSSATITASHQEFDVFISNIFRTVKFYAKNPFFKKV